MAKKKAYKRGASCSIVMIKGTRRRICRNAKGIITSNSSVSGKRTKAKRRRK